MSRSSAHYDFSPVRSQTPYVARPTTSSPATASALAESPSVRMSVVSRKSDARPHPARYASSSFGTFRRCP